MVATSRTVELARNAQLDAADATTSKPALDALTDSCSRVPSVNQAASAVSTSPTEPARPATPLARLATAEPLARPALVDSSSPTPSVLRPALSATTAITSQTDARNATPLRTPALTCAMLVSTPTPILGHARPATQPAQAAWVDSSHSAQPATTDGSSKTVPAHQAASSASSSLKVNAPHALQTVTNALMPTLAPHARLDSSSATDNVSRPAPLEPTTTRVCAKHVTLPARPAQDLPAKIAQHALLSS
jgi:hypothetical protein